MIMSGRDARGPEDHEWRVGSSDLLRPNDLDGRGGVHDQPALLVLEVAVQKADRAAPAHHLALGIDDAGTHRLEEADLEFERRHGDGELALDDGSGGHRRIDHAGEEAALADLALRMTEGGHDLETEARRAARGIDIQQLAVQGLHRFGWLRAERGQDL